jgi:hypothetical protein
VLVDVRPLSLSAHASLAVVLAVARPAAFFARASSSVVLADARPVAFLARASFTDKGLGHVVFQRVGGDRGEDVRRRASAGPCASTFFPLCPLSQCAHLLEVYFILFRTRDVCWLCTCIGVLVHKNLLSTIN